MKIKCSCGAEIVEGEIVERNNKKIFDIYYKPNGTIVKNNSNNTKYWTGICSDCQSSNDKNKSKNYINN